MNTNNRIYSPTAFAPVCVRCGFNDCPLACLNGIYDSGVLNRTKMALYQNDILVAEFSLFDKPQFYFKVPVGSSTIESLDKILSYANINIIDFYDEHDIIRVKGHI